MHQALQIDEIVTNVLCLVGPQVESLAALARVCHAFSEPALDALWSDLGNLFPLLRCLPSDLITYYPSTSTDSRGGPRFRLKRRFKRSDWEIFFKYAARVVNLRANSAGPECIPPDLYLALSFPPTSNAFPKLRRLHWTESKETMIMTERCMLMRQLLVPSIVDLTLHFSNGPTLTTHALGLVSILGAVCPNVKRFQCLRPANPGEGVMEAFSEAIRSWHVLEDVDCTVNLDSAAFRHLASLHSLRNLYLWIPALRQYPGDIWGAPDGPCFPGIQSFTFVSPSGTLSAVAQLVNSLQQRHLSPRKFIAGAKEASTNSMTKLFGSFINSFDRDALTSLSVFENGIPGLTLPNSRINPDTFRHILPFNNLTYIEIQSGREVAIDNGTLLQMAGAWPNLTSLRINKEYGWRTRSNITLQGLRDMLKMLPRLVWLAVAIDGNTLHPSNIESDNIGKFCIYRPFILDLLDSRISKNIPEVAAFLADIFPLHAIGRDDRSIHAWETRSSSGEPGEDATEWKTVIRTVGVINKISLKRSQMQLRFDRNGDYDSNGAYDIDGGLLCML